MPGPGVTWGGPVRGWGGVGEQGLDYAKASIWAMLFPEKPKHVGGRRRVEKEIPIYCSVMFIFTLGWFRAFS